MKPKKKRTKKYDPKKHRIGYLDMLDISANKGLSDRAAASIELDYRIHLQSFRTEPSTNRGLTSLVFCFSRTASPTTSKKAKSSGARLNQHGVRSMRPGASGKRSTLLRKKTFCKQKPCCRA